MLIGETKAPLPQSNRWRVLIMWF